MKTEALNVGLQRFLRRTAEARQGTGVLKKEFEKLGIALVDSFGYVRSAATMGVRLVLLVSATGVLGLFGARRSYQASAWLCPSDGRLYRASALRPADQLPEIGGLVNPFGHRLRCCEEEKA